MKTTKQKTKTYPTAREIYRAAKARGMMCLKISPLWIFLWIPWEKKVIRITQSSEIKKLFKLRNADALCEFCWHCTNHFEFMSVPAGFLDQYPMPEPANGYVFPDSQEMLDWAQKALVLVTKGNYK